MMHECARILNKQVAGEGLWHVDLSRCQNKQEGEVMEILPHDALDDNVAVAGATEHSDGEDASDKPDEDAEDHEDAVNDEETDAMEKMASDSKRSHAEETPDNPDDSAERQEHVTKDTTPLVGAAEHGDVAENASDQDKSKAQIFHVTVSLRDDWLHRGDALQDMDLQTYAEYIERAAKPIRGADMQKMVKWQIFAFDAHYKLANGFITCMNPFASL